MGRKVLLLLAMLALLLLAGCRSHKEAVRTEVRYVDRVRTDTVLLVGVDSVFVESRTVQDTVYLTKEAWRVRWRDRIKTDTVVVYVTRVDTVMVEKPVEAKLTWWQRVYIPLGRFALVGLVIGLIYVAWRCRKWVAKVLPGG